MIKLSHGNKKLISNDKVKFLIFSIPPIITCPYSTELCRKYCYAMKAYKMYPNVKKAWNENYNETLSNDFVSNMIEAIEKELARPSVKNAKRLVVRIHESGDFYNQEYADKWLKIAEHFENNNKVVFMAYTKSVRYFVYRYIPKNMTVRFSLWSDTAKEEHELAQIIGLPIYTAVESFTNESKKERCECVDCGHCAKCWNKSINMLKCEIH